MTKRFWGFADDEDLLDDPNKVIEHYLEDLPMDVVREIEELTVYEHRPMTPELSDCGHPLEYVLEMLDEEYGNPHRYGEATEAMKEAEQVFLRAVLAEYQSWMCERTGNKVTVKPLEWIRGHRPDWLQP